MSNTAACGTARQEYFVAGWFNPSQNNSRYPSSSLQGTAAGHISSNQQQRALIRLTTSHRQSGTANSSEQPLEAMLRGLFSATVSVPWPMAQPHAFRYWIDYQAFSSPESAALPEAALIALGGIRTGGPPKLDPLTAMKQKIKDYGYMHMDKWEVLLSITAKAMLAAEVLRPYQMVSIVPGCLCISRKTSLVRTLINTYGPEVAFTVVPRTFKLPEELDSWDNWIKKHPQQDTGLWMLKNNKQRGTGLRLVPTARAFEACFETTTRPGLEGITLYRWYLAQQYITRPLLINGCKFGIRVWVTVPGVSPLRVYMHRNGLALFSSEAYQPADFVDGTFGSGHITNYAQNENGDVWSLQHLATHMGQSVWKGIWQQLARVTALVFAAALRRIQEVQAQMDLHPRQTFQYFGLDFLLDCECHPWLMEVNATPSMKVAHEAAHTEQLIQQQKWEFVQDTFQLLRMQQHMFDEAAMSRPVGIADVSSELRARGSLFPLMHLFPTEEHHPGLSIPWTMEDQQLQQWIPSSQLYQAALKELETAHEVN